MLLSSDAASVRFSSADSLERYVAGEAGSISVVSSVAALEESFFLGLRLNRGVDLVAVAAEFGEDEVSIVRPVIADCMDGGFLWRNGDAVGLTSRGRMVSNEVFEKFVGVGLSTDQAPEGVR
jgi:oxygen-independent coproporphyrinogen-3 oxidase